MLASSKTLFKLNSSIRAFSTNFDYVVVGAGSGGIASARRAAGHGAKVAVVESGRLGGTCVNVGCVPKKVMYHAADLRELMKDGPGYGIGGSEMTSPSVDWGTLKRRRDAYIARLNGIYKRNLGNSGVETIEGRGMLLSDGRVEVLDDAGNSRGILEAKNVLLAMGGKPVIPEIEGARDYGLTSDDFFALETQPKSVVVVGAGYIATELAGVFHGLGTEVTMAVRGETLLRGFDEDVQYRVSSEMAASGVDLRFGVEVVRVESVEEDAPKRRRKVTFSDGDEVLVDEVLFATGRRPNTDGFASSGLTLNRSTGAVVVDAQNRTNLQNVFALGDVSTSPFPLTPVAIAEGRLLADRLFAKSSTLFHAADIPTAVFSHPPIGTVGLTEAAARAEYKDNVVVHKGSFTSLYYGILDRKPKSLVKLVCVRDSPDTPPGLERVVGIHIVDPSAPEMLQGFAVALRMGATKQDFDATVAIHPTSAEELVTFQPWNPRP